MKAKKRKIQEILIADSIKMNEFLTLENPKKKMQISEETHSPWQGKMFL